MAPLKVSIVTPVFNEEQVLPHFHRRLRGVLDALPDVEATIVFVLDRCTDNSLGVLREIVSNDPLTKFVALSSRFGHQMSLLAGLEQSLSSDAIIMMDSDLQHPPELVPQMIEAFQRGHDVVYTNRVDNEDASAIRKSMGKLFYRFLGRMSSVAITENSADFRLVSQRVAHIIAREIREQNIFLRGIVPWIGFNQVGIDYQAEARFAGQSKYSLSRMIQLASAGILSFSTKPLQLGIFVGVGFAALAFLLSVVWIIDYFIDRSIPSGWTTIAVLLLMFSGVQLIVIGVLGAYIGGIYQEVKGRPRYIIEEIAGKRD
ncbi:glycosyltransferase family 2 protein [Caballeronia novacaledonica]|uniref:Glycosyltransferase family 2 protein n=1 Tax=Caballeronia novacaledonica TaxID=1544861 RepID=A0ACB5R122_9BURK|nr:glycosyltransferase family 2 protein [Caballeronia novacaledonica]